jgi:hypothetical protein
MTRLADYATAYQTIRMERRDGILQMTFHTEGGPLQWGLLPHGEFPQAFRDVGADPENKVVILTGTGNVFSGPQATGGTGMRSTPAQWDRVYWEGQAPADERGLPRDLLGQRPGARQQRGTREQRLGGQGREPLA